VEKYIVKRIIKKTDKETPPKTEEKTAEKKETGLRRGTFMERLKVNQKCFFLECDAKAGLLLFILFPKPKLEIIQKFQQMQEVEVTFTKINGVAFLCFKFEGMDWIECPIPPYLFMQKEIAVQNKIQLSLVIADSSNGFVQEIYRIPLEQKFQKDLKKELDDLTIIPTIEEYERKIDSVYLQYDTPQKIKNLAMLHTKSSR
jgi:hypothetical protein